MIQPPWITDNCALLFDAIKQKWLLFSQPLHIISVNKYQDIQKVLTDLEKKISEKKNLYAAGFVAYEAGSAFDPSIQSQPSETFPLLWFGIYEQPQILASPLSISDSETNTSSAIIPTPTFKLISSPFSWQASVSKQEYYQALQKIRDYIGLGQSYQINYTFRLETSSQVDINPWYLFTQMLQNQGKCYGAFIQNEHWAITSASPELFFQLQGDNLESQPMKGTIPRGLDYTQDLKKQRELQASAKDRAENAMIVDMVRNDLGKIAKFGKVQTKELFHIENYPTLWQMTSKVVCQTQAGISQIFKVLFPPASVTGTPKIEATKIISQLEKQPRGVYTGAIGFLAPKRRAQFNVAIRTAFIDRKHNSLSYGLGSGIVWDSEAQSEWEECHTKAKILQQRFPKFSLIESILWTPEENFFLLDYHLERLKQSASYFSYPLNVQNVQSQLIKLANKFKNNQSTSQKVRLLLNHKGQIYLQWQKLSQEKKLYYRLGLAKSAITLNNPFLYHKTSWRVVYEIARQSIKQYDDVLLWNERGEVTETSIANIVIELKGQLYTPPISCGLLGGTYRALLLKQNKIQEKVILCQELRQCSKIYLINSVRKWQQCMLCLDN